MASYTIITDTHTDNAQFELGYQRACHFSFWNRNVIH